MVQARECFYLRWAHDAWRVYGPDGDLVAVSQWHREAVFGFVDWAARREGTAALYGPLERGGKSVLLASTGRRRHV